MVTGSTYQQYNLYSHVVPNSHMWTSLAGLKVSVDQDVAYHATTKERKKRIKKSEYSIIDCYEPLTFEYIIIGLKNAIKRGYVIKQVKKTGWTFPPELLTLQFLINTLDTEGSTMLGFQMTLLNYIQCGYEMKKVKIKIKMKRKKVYKVVDGELDYQDLKWVPRRDANGTPDDQKPPAEWINYMEWHISKAKEKVYMLDDEGALEEIRKVTALGVRALMIHGCPEREIPQELLDAQ